MNAVARSTQRLERALVRASTAQRGTIMKARVQLELARTEHLKLELKQERKNVKAP
jgi:hypothetical protein